MLEENVPRVARNSNVSRWELSSVAASGKGADREAWKEVYVFTKKVGVVSRPRRVSL